MTKQVMLVIIIALIICLVPFITYQEKIPYDYEVLNASCSYDCGGNPSDILSAWCYPVYRVTIKNTDTEIASYVVEFTVPNYTLEDDGVVAPGNKKTFEVRGGGMPGSWFVFNYTTENWSYKVIPGMKTTYKRVGSAIFQ